MANSAKRKPKFKMARGFKIGLTIISVIIIVTLIYTWRFLGKPYYRISLIGTQYIENADELSFANERLDNNLYLIKKYKFSEDNWLIGFGGGSSVTDDYYSYGVSDEQHNILLKPKFQFISSKINSQNEPIIFGLPYVKTGNEKVMFYKIVNGKAQAIDEKDSW